MSEVIEEGVTGLLAEPGDVASLVSDALDALLGDGRQASEFGRAGRQRYLQLYTREALIRAHDRILSRDNITKPKSAKFRARKTQRAALNSSQLVFKNSFPEVRLSEKATDFDIRS